MLHYAYMRSSEPLLTFACGKFFIGLVFICGYTDTDDKTILLTFYIFREVKLMAQYSI